MKEISLTLDCEVTNYVKEYVIYPNQYTGNHMPIKIYDVMGFECANLEEFNIREIFAIKKSSVTNDGDRGRSSVLCTGRQKNTQRSMFEELRFKIIK